jgi:hypothetical protein
MATIPNRRPAYQGKSLTKQSQGKEAERRTGKGDPTLLRRNEPPIPADHKLGLGTKNT